MNDTPESKVHGLLSFDEDGRLEVHVTRAPLDERVEAIAPPGSAGAILDRMRGGDALRQLSVAEFILGAHKAIAEAQARGDTPVTRELRERAEQFPADAQFLEAIAWVHDPELARTLLWPADVRPADVCAWLAKHAPDRDAAAWYQREIDAAFRAQPLDITTRRVQLTVACVFAALVFRTWTEMQRARARLAIAVDAGRPHHDFLSGWRDLPKLPGDKVKPVCVGDRYEIIAPNGKSTQLLLPMEDGGLHQATINTLREWRQWEGVRNWAALLRLFSVEGSRSGSVRWTLDAHLEALGYGERARRTLAVRDAVAREVELLTRLELAVYHPNGRLRAREALIRTGTKYEALRDATWRIEGMELQINPLLYQGVRAGPGELGVLWYPAPIELAQIDHVRYPHAIALGLVLPMRWRWDLEKSDHVALSGSSLVEAAGIKHSAANPQRTWQRLRENLAELQRRDGLGRYTWDETPEPWSFRGICRLYPPQWARDRTVHGVRPLELPPTTSVLTGAELRAWRERQGLSQAGAATRLGVGIATIKRAEKNPAAPLGHAIRDAVAQTG